MTTPSGKFVLRLPSDTHLKLQTEAANRGISMNQFCLETLQSKIEQSDGDSVVALISNNHSAAIKLSVELIQKLNLPLKGVVLFGSYARARQSQSSDIDLLIVLSEEANLTRGLYSSWDGLVNKMNNQELKKVSPHFVCLPKDASSAGGIWFEIAIEGILLFDPICEVNKFLSGLRIYMISNNVRSKITHGHRYWIKDMEAA